MYIVYIYICVCVLDIGSFWEHCCNVFSRLLLCIDLLYLDISLDHDIAEKHCTMLHPLVGLCIATCWEPIAASIHPGTRLLDMLSMTLWMTLHSNLWIYIYIFTPSHDALQSICCVRPRQPRHYLRKSKPSNWIRLKSRRVAELSTPQNRSRSSTAPASATSPASAPAGATTPATAGAAATTPAAQALQASMAGGPHLSLISCINPRIALARSDWRVGRCW